MTLLSGLSLLRKNSTYKDVKKQYLKVQIFYPKSDKNLANQRQNKTCLLYTSDHGSDDLGTDGTAKKR